MKEYQRLLKPLHAMEYWDIDEAVASITRQKQKDVPFLSGCPICLIVHNDETDIRLRQISDKISELGGTTFFAALDKTLEHDRWLLLSPDYQNRLTGQALSLFGRTIEETLRATRVKVVSFADTQCQKRANEIFHWLYSSYGDRQSNKDGTKTETILNGTNCGVEVVSVFLKKHALASDNVFFNMLSRFSRNANHYIEPAIREDGIKIGSEVFLHSPPSIGWPELSGFATIVGIQKGQDIVGGKNKHPGIALTVASHTDETEYVIPAYAVKAIETVSSISPEVYRYRCPVFL